VTMTSPTWASPERVAAMEPPSVPPGAIPETSARRAVDDQRSVATLNQNVAASAASFTNLMPVTPARTDTVS